MRRHPNEYSLARARDPSAWESSRSGRVLASIRRDMDIKAHLFRERIRNEQLVALRYCEGDTIGSAEETRSLRQNILNLPWRHLRWFESQATSRKVIVKCSRDAGPGQKPNGPGDETVGAWVGTALSRVGHIAGFKRETKALIGEVYTRGTSVMRIGYHENEITWGQAKEVGKDAKSIIADVLERDDLEAKPGQDHESISKGLGEIAASREFQNAAGPEAVQKVLARKASHDDAALKSEMDLGPIESTREIRRRIYMRQLRVGEECGWGPHVHDVEDTPVWWERNISTVAEVKASPLFTAKFKKAVQGYDARNVSEVAHGGQTPSTEEMGHDARQAQGEDWLEDDERFVEWYSCWYRRPDMRSGGIRKIVAPEMPDDFVEADDSNPHVDDDGYGLIPGFYPFYDFTPHLPTLRIPERTCGIPPMSVGSSQVEQLAEYNRLRQEGALKSATRLIQLHPEIANRKKILKDLENGAIYSAFIAPSGLVDSNGKMMDAAKLIAFPGGDPEIDRQAVRTESDWVKVTGFPPAILQGMGTAETATQDKQGIAGSERESGTVLEYLEDRMGDVFAGIRGLMRGNYDDDDFLPMLGEEGAAALKAWQTGTVDIGDEVTVTFGSRALAHETVEKKQLMEAISLLRAEVEPLSGLPIYKSVHLVEELFRRLDVGSPQESDGPMRALQSMVMELAKQIQQLTGENPLDPKSKGTPARGGPSPSEGDGPSEENISSGAARGTVAPEPAFAGSGNNSFGGG